MPPVRRKGHLPIRTIVPVEPLPIEKVWITGNAGVGKTSLGGELGEALRIPFHSLDSIVWQSGWKKTADDLKQASIAELVTAERWVIEGVSLSGMREADLVVFLDLPRVVAASRALRRTMRYRFQTRPGLPDDCPEILITRRLLKIIRRFRRYTRPLILEAARERAQAGQRFVHIRTTAQQNELSAKLRAARGDSDLVVQTLVSLAARSPRP